MYAYIIIRLQEFAYDDFTKQVSQCTFWYEHLQVAQNKTCTQVHSKYYDKTPGDKRRNNSQDCQYEYPHLANVE